MGEILDESGFSSGVAMDSELHQIARLMHENYRLKNVIKQLISYVNLAEMELNDIELSKLRK